MKTRILYIGCALVLAAELVALLIFALASPDVSQDTVAVNEVVRSVEKDFYAMDTHVHSTALDYVVLDTNGNVFYKTREGLSESDNEAIAHRDTVLDISRDGEVVGKVIVYNDGAQTLRTQKRTATVVFAAALILQCAICIGYAVYIRSTVIRPFRKLKDFAVRVAGGNLDIPLAMDRHNLFGAFTESFDLLRSELKKARIAEAQAEQSKKELVAKLSHDIKTPVASIKAVAEVGLAVTEGEKDKADYTQIVSKADQIAVLVTNLFAATLDELQQLSVTPVHTESGQIKTMLLNADYLHRAQIPDIPACLVYADGVRLQQVFDNIFSNSYKYTDTEIFVTAEKTETELRIATEDLGGGVAAEELPALKEKFKRGRNAAHIEGAGLGLYISDCFLREMQGNLRVENGAHGLKVTVTLRLSGKTQNVRIS